MPKVAAMRVCGEGIAAASNPAKRIAERPAIKNPQPRSEIERGETNITLQTLKTLADTLNVRITDLLDGL